MLNRPGACGRPPAFFTRGGVFLVLVLCITVTATALEDASAPTDALSSAYDAALRHEAPSRNLVYFYLRVAGLVWIVVEWCAAIILILAYRAITRGFPRKETAP